MYTLVSFGHRHSRGSPPCASVHPIFPRSPRWLFACFVSLIGAISVARADDPQSGITHGFLATGAETYIRDGQGNVTWRYPASTRDGWLLPNGDILLVLSKSKAYPGGGVVEIQKDGKVVFEYKGTQAEVTRPRRSTASGS